VNRHLRGLIASLAVLLAAMASPPPARATTIERVVSPGGIEAWLVREPSLPLIAMNFAFLGGANEDPTDKPGVGYMTASLLDNGAGELNSKAFQEQVEETAVQLQFSITRDYFVGSVRMLRDRQEQSVNLLRLALNQPRFDADEIERVRAQILAGLRREITNPSSIANRTWWKVAYGHHPYGRPNNGTLESVPTITVDDIKSYAGRVLTREHLKVAAVGDIDAAGLGALLDRVFGSLPAKGELSPVVDLPPSAAGRRIVVQLDVPQSVVYMGGAGITRKDPDFIPAYLVNHILGGGSFTSRLYEEVREKRGLAYGVYSYLLTLRHSALLMASTQASADRTGQALDLIEAQIRRMVDEGPTEAELAKAKAYLKGSYPLNFDTSAKISKQLLQIQLDDLGIDYINKRNGLIDAVTLDDARRAAKRLAGGGMFVTVVGRPKELVSKDPTAQP
jgi:zinc protease